MKLLRMWKEIEIRFTWLFFLIDIHVYNFEWEGPLLDRALIHVIDLIEYVSELHVYGENGARIANKLENMLM